MSIAQSILGHRANSSHRGVFAVVQIKKLTGGEGGGTQVEWTWAIRDNLIDSSVNQAFANQDKHIWPVDLK